MSFKHRMGDPMYNSSAMKASRLEDILAPEANNFGVIRIAMALAVLVSHSFFFVAGTPGAEPLTSWTGHSLGEHAVQVFFFLSGVLVTESLMRSRSLIDFATARTLRVFPGLSVCVVLTAFVLGPLVTTHSAGTYWGDPALPAYILKTVLLISGAAPLPGVFSEHPASNLVNMSLWTLKYEVLCYAALATIGFTALRQDRWRGPTTLVLAAVIFTVFLRAPQVGETYSAIENVRYFTLYFGMGTLAALVKERLVIDWKSTAVLGVAYATLSSTPWAELTCALFIGALTILAAGVPLGRMRSLANRWDVSFGIYIYASPVQQTLLQVDPTLDPLSLSLIAIIPVGVLALASWTWVEKPSLVFRRTVVAQLQSTWAVSAH